ncbi:transcriptional regulator [Avibacterium paragallinarum]|uniref:Helix-turn-helix domain-containing protein n=1 Tax=Avibacterium paragallinarum TaxID=728 RepID=A0ABU7QKH8_AVIPA|nr:Cro/CI family transcriptional regulator [Avibacterium paragallinarum]QZP14731.1 helix-turn-helix domain-containing protein [Avibacterium paragallinarum]WAL56640.1 Cro/CI family transcriptional regulator [Avibacterium paragallinarum]WAM59168.1 Cro/CI family transcriptional regulator [Avibacterium paragallinarum]
MNKSIQKAINVLGKQQLLAEACGVSQNAVSKWLNGGSISLENALRIEKATQGRVKAEEISPEFSHLLSRD